MNIIMIGPRASGKTTVGRVLSIHINRPFLDTDELIEKREGISISDMVDIYGWSYFRALEKNIISNISDFNHFVISVGGGAVLDQENRSALKKNGFIVFLTAKPEILVKRMANDPSTTKSRPTLTGEGSLEEIEEVLFKRYHIYKTFSDLEIDTSDLEVNDVVERILFKLKVRGIWIGRKYHW